MRITIRFFAAFREAVGERELEWETEECTVGSLLDALRERFPALASFPSFLVAVNREFASMERELRDGDEVAVFPPVSGGGQMFEVVREPICVEDVVAKVSRPSCGAVVAFIGTVRETSHGERVLYLEYEAYPEMALKEMRRIAEEIRARWPVEAVAITHRVGKLEIGEISVVIALSGAHREGLFQACRYAIDRLKEIVPVWKKEVSEKGAVWVGSGG